MNANRVPVAGVFLGDHAGIGPEIVAMTLCRQPHDDYAVFLVGNLELFRRAMACVPDCGALEIIDATREPMMEKKPGKIYFFDVPARGEIPFGQVTAASGHLIYDGMQAALKQERMGAMDGFVMGPITKQALHAAGLSYSSEFEIFSDFYGTQGVRAVVKAGDICRCTVVGHVRFTEIVSRLTPDGIVATAHALLEVMKRFRRPDDVRIAVAALNPHAGEDGLFGDEESTILQPAIDRLRAEGVDVIGPCPADTVYHRAQTGKVGGIVYLFHDQGNIAMKAASFGDGVLIYVHVPTKIVSVGHGGAFGSAGRGTASPQNMIASLHTLVEMIREEA